MALRKGSLSSTLWRRHSNIPFPELFIQDLKRQTPKDVFGKYSGVEDEIDRIHEHIVLNKQTSIDKLLTKTEDEEKAKAEKTEARAEREDNNQLRFGR